MSFHKGRKHEEVEENWLMSYADMITLLISFFVILLSVMEKKQTHKEEVEQAIKESFSSSSIDDPMPFTQLVQDLQQVIENNQMEENMSLEETEKGVMLELSSSSFYKSGSAEFLPEAIPVLKDISVILNDFSFEDYIVRVEGHTDDVPITTPYFPSNWELSAVRATKVVRYFIDSGQPKEKMSAEGFADTQPKVPNIDEYGNPIPENREINRRILIRIERREE